MRTKLVLFDGDDTLWTPLSGLWLSDRKPIDEEGWKHYTFEADPLDPLTVRRDDGALFGVRPEAGPTMSALNARGVLAGVASFNHEGNVTRMLAACGLLSSMFCVIAEWHRDKGLMLERARRAARDAGYLLDPSDIFLVDDDYYGLYGDQCAGRGFGFVRFGGEVTDLRQVVDIVTAS